MSQDKSVLLGIFNLLRTRMMGSAEGGHGISLHFDLGGGVIALAELKEYFGV